ncbi:MULTISPECIES: SpoIIE family protein phosphatase [unclassified Streptomyces]|uniref:SpoIIE family protein phosphatase n=1 Tax=unclassified Streptomyces TaxID=2593676 RepID=UPI002DDA6FF7|nr:MULTISPECIES: SpoIIE family protein phosphatase [unclassified Streptomyces]WSF89192.1 SpoIIE family protein phosphatase [Streptomyces sp. NBC_01744]WSC43047.1 SpoIIE family protein phosphatase [Streptomyces sp. NBC_01762]WSC58093.1 SpoIIE family protein phosphatase [Streptomyces sp. NBC_01761]WSD22584.1 SpoIIE family protein phosphatase [Streptomyces sp. NBC_01751]WSJ55403.1 SpoIIE family protein phosphatase [Streptomyces sp. NBC_01318]
MDTPASMPGDSFTPAAALAVAAPDGTLTGWSTGAEQLLGYAAGEAVGRLATALLASPVPAGVRERFDRQEDWTGHVVLRHRDGSAVECRLRARPLPTGDRRPGWLLEGIREREENRDTDPLLRWSFDQSPFALAIYDTEGRFLRVNERMTKQLAATERDLRGLRITEHMPDPAFQAPERSVDHVLRTGEPEHIENYVKVPGESRAHAWTIQFTPLKDSLGLVHGVQLAALDFSEQYAARERLALLDEASRRIGSSLDVARTAQELADVAVPDLADFVSVDLFDAVLHGDEPPPVPDDGPLVLRRVATRPDVKAVVAVGELSPFPGFSPVARSLATGRGTLHRIGEPEITRWLAHDPVRTAWVSRHRAHSLMVVPLRGRGTNLGVVLFARLDPSAGPYEQADLQIARELAARAAVCLDNARRYTREHTTTLALQHSLLPQGVTKQAAVDVASRYLPADSKVGVGGDWFDVIPLSGARVALVVGDVVGHGMHASAAMGRLRTAVRALADVDLAPDELLAHLDDLVVRLGSGPDSGTGTPFAELGATCLYAVYDPISRKCSLASAGHLWPALVTPDGTVDFLELPTGPPLGLGGLPFEAVERELPEGSLLTLYTDGLVEAQNRDVNAGLHALRTALADTAQSLEATCDRVLDALLGEQPADDVALLIARTRALDNGHVAVWDLPADPAFVAEARSKATAQLHAWGLDDLAYVTELVVSELVTNAIRYAAAPVQLRLIKERTLICEVSDASSTAPHLRRARIFDEGGRGLMLVAQLTERWGMRHTGTGKTIWAEQPLPE